MSGPRVSLDENAVRKILARAVEIENQQRGALTEAQVRDIARDLSIPDHVIEQALAEYRTPDTRETRRPRMMPRWLGPLAIVGFVTILLLVVTFMVRIAPPPH